MRSVSGPWRTGPPRPRNGAQIPYRPARVLLQDFTGVPAVVDLAAMRSAMRRAGKDASRIDPLVPADLVIDHSVQVDVFGMADAYTGTSSASTSATANATPWLRWAQQASTLPVVPPAWASVTR